MHAAVRPGIAMSAVAAMAVGSAIAVTPVIARATHIPTTIDGSNVLLAGFIDDIYNQIQPIVAGIVDTATAAIGAVPIVGPPVADQIDILYTYTQQAVGATVNLADDLVTPLVTGQFWPVSGQPGNYVTGAINSTVIWGQSLINTAIGFAQAEIDYFTGWIPNLPGVITNIYNQIVNTIQQVIDWITGVIPVPFAAVATPAAAATKVAGPRAAAARRSAVKPAAAVVATDTGAAVATAGKDHRPSGSPAAAAAKGKRSARTAAAARATR